jgi:hypothetical protein
VHVRTWTIRTAEAGMGDIVGEPVGRGVVGRLVGARDGALEDGATVVGAAEVGASVVGDKEEGDQVSNLAVGRRVTGAAEGPAVVGDSEGLPVSGYSTATADSSMTCCPTRDSIFSITGCTPAGFRSSSRTTGRSTVTCRCFFLFFFFFVLADGAFQKVASKKQILFFCSDRCFDGCGGKLAGHLDG